MEIAALSFCFDIPRVGPERRVVFDIAFPNIVMHGYTEDCCAKYIG
jgi:hypothetical protein